jgi:hypothetical protein
MIRVLAFMVGATLLVAANVAQATCSYEGQRYPTGTALCIGGKLNICEANSAWKVDRSSSC